MVKPDGVHRGLIADVIKRFEQKGYKLVGIKVLSRTWHHWQILVLYASIVLYSR